MSERAAIYCRVSSKGQEDNYSLASQLKNCREYAEREGYDVSEGHVYRDVSSGFDLDRPQLTELREALRRGEIDVVIVNSYDRWSSRNSDLYRLYTDLQHGNSALVSVTQGVFQDTAIGRAVVNMYTTGRELWLEDHRERTVRGRRARVANGQLLPGNRPPYGYLWKDGDKTGLIPNLETAPVVQRIFREIAGGGTARGIAMKFTEEGIPTPTGATKWAQPTVSAMVRKSIYYGEARALVYQHVKDTNGKRRMAQRPENEQVIIPDAAPALVTKELAEQVLMRLSRNRSVAIRNNRNPEAALLRGGFGVCGYCGKPLNAINYSTKGITVYRCNTGNSYRYDCPSFTINADKLDDPVWAKVEEILTQPAIISDELKRLHENDPTVGDIKTIERVLADNERKQRNLVERLADEDDDEIAALLKVKLHDLIKQKNELQQERERITQQQEGWRIAQERLDDIEAWCQNVAANLKDLTYDQKRVALEALGVKVHVWREDHDPRWRMQTNIMIRSGSP